MSTDSGRECATMQKNLRKVLEQALNENLGSGVPGSKVKIPMTVFRARTPAAAVREVKNLYAKADQEFPFKTDNLALEAFKRSLYVVAKKMVKASGAVTKRARLALLSILAPIP